VEKARTMEMDIREMERHGTALGDLEGFVEVGAGAGDVVFERMQPCAGEKAAGEIVLLARSAKTVYRGVDVADCRFSMHAIGRVKDREIERGTTENEVIEGDVEEPAISFCNRNGLHSAHFNFPANRYQLRPLLIGILILREGMPRFWGDLCESPDSRPSPRPLPHLGRLRTCRQQG